MRHQVGQVTPTEAQQVNNAVGIPLTQGLVIIPGLVGSDESLNLHHVTDLQYETAVNRSIATNSTAQTHCESHVVWKRRAKGVK